MLVSNPPAPQKKKKIQHLVEMQTIYISQKIFLLKHHDQKIMKTKRLIVTLVFPVNVIIY